MAIREYEGKNKQEAIQKAIEALGLQQDEIDVEVVESKKPGIFRGGKVKIRVHVTEDPEGEESLSGFDQEAVNFVAGLVERMGIDGRVRVASREEGKIVLDIATEDPGILIGKHGSTLEALQLIVNIVCGRIQNGATRVIIDSQDYRYRRELALVRLANRVAEDVRRSKRSKLLEPMNPFERRLIHTTLSGSEDVYTESEGEGLYKKVRVSYAGRNHSQPQDR